MSSMVTTSSLAVLIPFPCLASLQYLSHFPDLQRHCLSMRGALEGWEATVRWLWRIYHQISPKPGALALEVMLCMPKWVAQNTLLALQKPFEQGLTTGPMVYHARRLSPSIGPRDLKNTWYHHYHHRHIYNQHHVFELPLWIYREIYFIYFSCQIIFLCMNISHWFIHFP